MRKKIDDKIKEAMRSKKTEELLCFRMIKSLLIEEDKKKDIKRSDVEVIDNYCSKLKKATQIQGVPEEFKRTTDREIEIIKQFLPAEMSFEEAVKFTETIRDMELSCIISLIKEEAKKRNKLLPGRIAFLAAKKMKED